MPRASMKYQKIIFRAVWLCLAIGQAQANETVDPEVDQTVRLIDNMYRGASSRALIEMHIVTPRWERKLLMSVSTLGENKTFIRIKEPAKEKGVGTLRFGDEIWNYLPRAGDVVRIPPSLLMNSWMGSDFTNDDLVKQYTFFRDHTCVRVTAPVPPVAEFHIRCVPKPGVSVLWDHVLVVTEKASKLPLRQDFFDSHDALIRSLVYSEVSTLGGRKVPAVVKMIPALAANQYTEIRYKALEFDVKLPEEVFSRRYLQGSQD